MHEQPRERAEKNVERRFEVPGIALLTANERREEFTTSFEHTVEGGVSLAQVVQGGGGLVESLLCEARAGEFGGEEVVCPPQCCGHCGGSVDFEFVFVELFLLTEFAAASEKVGSGGAVCGRFLVV